MPSWLFDNPIALVVGIAAIWVFMRFGIGSRRGGPGLAALLRREKALKPVGMGRAAIATLIETTRRFAGAEPGLRGLILAGPFAARTAGPQSTVSFILIAEEPQAYADRDWIARWPYPQVGHPVLGHETGGADGITHRLSLRGSPPIAFHFVRFDAFDVPADLAPLFEDGAETLDDPSGLAEKLRRHWIDRINHAKDGPP
jgi:hypothetical protein